MNDDVDVKQNNHLGISFILSLVIWSYLWWSIGLWNLLLSLLFPVYFIIINLIQLIFASKSPTSFYQVLYYVDNNVRNNIEKTDIPVNQAVDSAISAFKKICFRLKNEDKFWHDVKYAAMYNASNSNKYYELLELDQGASIDEIKKAYKRLSKKYHPDMNINKNATEKLELEEKFKIINNAYNILINIDHK